MRIRVREGERFKYMSVINNQDSQEVFFTSKCFTWRIDERESLSFTDGIDRSPSQVNRNEVECTACS